MRFTLRVLARVRNALRLLAGVQEVQASAATHQAVVTFGPTQVGPGQVQAKLEQLGYEVAPHGDGR